MKSGESMAKKVVEKIQIEQPENKISFFQKFFFWFLIPLVFCIALLLIFAMFTKKNVFEYIDDIPFISSNDEQQVTNISTQNEEKLVTLQAELQEKEVEVSQLQSKVDAASSEKQELELEIERLNYEIEKLKVSQEEASLEFKEVLSTFEKMSAKKAAPIIVEMSDDEAVRILSNMKPATLTAIFEKMTPENAAKYTQLLTN
jgi:flagellar protein FlbB